MPKRSGAKILGKTEREKKIDEELRRQEERRRKQAQRYGQQTSGNSALDLGARMFQGFNR